MAIIVWSILELSNLSLLKLKNVNCSDGSFDSIVDEHEGAVHRVNPCNYDLVWNLLCVLLLYIVVAIRPLEPGEDGKIYEADCPLVIDVILAQIKLSHDSPRLVEYYHQAAVRENRQENLREKLNLFDLQMM